MIRILSSNSAFQQEVIVYQIKEPKSYHIAYRIAPLPIVLFTLCVNLRKNSESKYIQGNFFFFLTKLVTSICVLFSSVSLINFCGFCLMCEVLSATSHTSRDTRSHVSCHPSAHMMSLPRVAPPSSHRSAGYTQKRLTENLKVPYYVGEQFSKEFTGVILKNLERTVEDDYISSLRNNCWKEKQQSTHAFFF